MEDFDSLTLEQIRELASAKAAEQTRDELGRFTKPEEPAPVEPEPVEEEEVEEAAPEVFEEVIDLGDGAGVQVFRADSEKALRLKLVDAQRNATKKIREQEKRLREIEQAAAPKLSADERYLLAQRIMTEPDVVISEFAERIYQQKQTEAQRQQAAAQAAATERAQIAEAWCAKNPDFYNNLPNARKIDKYLSTQGLEFTEKNLDLAFSEMKDILQPPPKSEAPPSTPAPAAPPAPVRRASNISARRTPPPPPVPEVDPYDMPMDKLREMIQKNHASLQNQ